MLSGENLNKSFFSLFYFYKRSNCRCLVLLTKLFVHFQKLLQWTGNTMTNSTESRSLELSWEKMEEIAFEWSQGRSFLWLPFLFLFLFFSNFWAPFLQATTPMLCFSFGTSESQSEYRSGSLTLTKEGNMKKEKNALYFVFPFLSLFDATQFHHGAEMRRGEVRCELDQIT